MAYGIIYCLTNTVTGKSYVGQTTYTLEQRWAQHRCQAKKSNSGCLLLYNSMRKHGVDVFSHRILEVAETKQDLDSLEIYWIAELGTKAPSGYNLKDGGSRGKPSEETRARQRASHLGKVLSQEQCESMSKSQSARRVKEKLEGTGPQFSQASRLAMRQAKLGRNLSEEHKAKLSIAGKGRAPSEETRAKLRASRLDYHTSEQTKAKIREARLGQKASDETKARMRASQLARYARSRADQTRL